MANKRAGRNRKKDGAVPPDGKPPVRVGAKLTEAEEDLLRHMEQGWRLESDSLGGNPVLRSLKDDEVVRPASANRSTVKSLEERGLIVQGQGGDPLRIEWKLNTSQ